MPAPDFSALLRVLSQWGWMVLPFILFLIWKAVWLSYIRQQYAKKIKWKTLEMTIPNIVERTPKVMEQVFTGLHAIASYGNFVEKYFYGKHQLHIIFEIASIDGYIKFFIKTPAQYQRIIESQIYSQYKDAEIIEVNDYFLHIPNTIPNKHYDLWGTELLLTKDDAYPIRTYRHFEEPSMEKKIIDPLSALMELLGEIRDNEKIIVQYLFRPTGDAWQKEGQKLIDTIIGKKSGRGVTNNIVEEVFQFFYDMFAALFMGNPIEEKQKQKDEKQNKENFIQDLTPGMKDVVAALEENIAKHGFEVGIRIVYIAPPEIFAKENIIAVLGSFKQFSTYNLNGFKANARVSPSVDYFFVRIREEMRKKKLFNALRDREFVLMPMILNTEELATVYHIPSFVVDAPMLPKVIAKKAEPPSKLPTV